MGPTEIRDLIHRANDGDRGAWNEIVEEYTCLVWSVVRGFRFDQARAEDAVQTTWLKLVEHISTIKDPERLAGWLQTTAKRVCLGLLRGSGRELLVDLQVGSATIVDRYCDRVDDEPQASVVRREQQAMARLVLARLPEPQRALMEMLVSSDPPSYQDISARLGIPVGSIGPTRARILSRLRQALAAADLNDMALS